MSLFGGKHKEKEAVFHGMLGIDIGTLGIKVVEIAREQEKPFLTTYGYGEVSGESRDILSGTDAKMIAEMLMQVCQESGTRAKKATASLPASDVFHTIVTIPQAQSQGEELRLAIEAQATKVFPLQREDMVLDSLVLPQDPATADRFVRVFLTGAPKTLIQKYLDIFSHTDLALISLESEVMALLRALIPHESGQVMIVDMGGLRTHVCVVQQGVPFLVRGIKSGGEDITKALANTMGITPVDAEIAKRDLGLGGDMLPQPLQTALQPLVHEIRYALQTYADQSSQAVQGVEKILLTGGSAQLPGIHTYLADLLHINVYVANPWMTMGYAPEARAILEEVGPRLSVAAGLALRVGESIKL